MEQEKNKFSLFFILLITFVNYMGIGLIYPIFATLLFDKTFSFLPADSSDLYKGFILGILLAIMPLIQFLSSAYLGKKSDSIGRKKILLFCIVLSIVGYAVALEGIWKESITFLFFFRILLGVSGACVVIVQAILVEMSKGQKAKYLSLFNLAMGAGFTIGPFIGGFFSGKNFIFDGNISVPFWLALVLTMLNLFLVLRYFTETKKVAEIPIPSAPVLKLVSSKIRSLLVCMFIFSFGWSFFFEFLPIFLKEQFGFSSPAIGNFYGYSGMFYMLCSAFVIKPLMQRVRSEILLLVAFIFSGFYIFLVYLIQHSLLLWFHIPFLVCLIATVFPTTSLLISDYAGDKNLGKTLGELIAVQSIAFAISPLLSGFLIGIHYATPIFLASISFILSGVIFAFYFPKKEKKEEGLETPLD